MSQNFKIIARGKIELRAEHNIAIETLLQSQQEAISAIWQTAISKKNQALFNGRLPVYLRHTQIGDDIKIFGHFIDYKNFFAQNTSPELKLDIKPISVSGITILKDGNQNLILLAQRKNPVTEYPGFFELAPSGSIDESCLRDDGSVDYTQQLATEFTEETGLAQNHIASIKSFVFVFDEQHHVFDIGCEIVLKTQKDFFLSHFQSHEYDQPILIPENDLGDFIAKNSDKLVPTSLALIDAYSKK